MAKFKVIITQIYSGVLTVEADSEDHAIEQVISENHELDPYDDAEYVVVPEE